MNLNFLDYFTIGLFGAFILYEILRSLAKRATSSAYFEAGRNLHWIYIGMSLLTADITIEYIIGSASEGCGRGLAIGSYEWTASIALIFVALIIVPELLRTGILTLPEYLEYRYNRLIRVIIAVVIVISNLVGLLVPILYTNALVAAEFFDVSPTIIIWVTGLLASTILLSGGLASKVRIDLVIGILFLVGACLVTTYAFIEIGGFGNFMEKSEGRMNSVLPANDTFLPWTTVFFGGLWVAHIYYWAFNQHITQTVLVSQTLSQAQKGMLFVATIKIILPFLLIVPGIIGCELLGSEVKEANFVLPQLIEKIIPVGLKGFIMVAYCGTVIGALNALLNASATIFVHDIYRIAKKNSTEREQVNISRIANITLLLIACIAAPFLNRERNIFEYSQVFVSAISPGFLAIFLFAVFSKRTPSLAALVAIVAVIPLYFILQNLLGDFFSSLDLAGINFLVLSLIMFSIRILYPLKEAVVMPERKPVRFERNLIVIIWSIFIVTAIMAVYLIFL